MKRTRDKESRVGRSKKNKRPNLAISSFKQGQIFKNEKGQIMVKFSSKICLNG